MSEMRRVIYLDHAVLSDAAKHPSSPVAIDLMTLVESDKAIFPFSWTHHREAELDMNADVARAIRRLGARLARGVRFVPRSQIAAEQARNAYLDFIGESEKKRGPKLAFEHDPRGEISERWLDSMLHSGVFTDRAGLTQRTSMKELAARSLAEQRGQAGQPEPFRKAKDRWAAKLVRSYFVDFSGPFRGRMLEEAMARKGLPALESVEEFLASGRCQAIPFIEIESTILASLETDEKNREYKPSDFYDIQTWSAYLPYVDMAVADQQMHQVLTKRQFATKFGCAIYPNNAAGLSSLIAQMKKGD